MKAEIWLKIQGKKYNRYNKTVHCGTVTAFKSKPSTSKDEITIKLSLDLPDSLFIKPELQAVISIPDDSVSAPTISADIQDNIAEILSEQIGLNINVSYPVNGGEND